MEKHQPNPATRVGELLELANKLRDNNAFHALRGRGKTSFCDLLAANANEAQSPKESGHKCQNTFDKLVAMNTVYSQLRRDAKANAEQEMSKALAIPGYIMERETFRAEDEQDYTLYIPEPVKTLRFMQTLKASPSVYRATLELGEILPSISRIMSAFDDGGVDQGTKNAYINGGWVAKAAYFKDVVCSFPPVEVLRNLHDGDTYYVPEYKEYDKDLQKWCRRMIANCVNQAFPYDEWQHHNLLVPGTAFFVRGSRKETLESLRDPAGLRTAAWSFLLPKWLEETLGGFEYSAFALFDFPHYHEHQEKWPSWTSLNLERMPGREHSLGVHLVGDIRTMRTPEFSSFRLS